MASSISVTVLMAGNYAVFSGVGNCNSSCNSATPPRRQRELFTVDSCTPIQELCPNRA
jgi:hypothetical protein